MRRGQRIPADLDQVEKDEKSGEGVSPKCGEEFGHFAPSEYFPAITFAACSNFFGSLGVTESPPSRHS